jgi:hypothetical protein
MTGIDHQNNPAITEAAMWLSEQYPSPAPLILTLHLRFNITPFEATDACALAELFRARRRAFA